MTGCAEKVLPPVIIAEKTSYSIKEGDTLTIAPIYQNCVDALYEWKIESQTISTEPILIYVGKTPGTVYPELHVTNNAAEAFMQFRITVSAGNPPKVTVPGSSEGIEAIENTPLEIAPFVTSATRCSFLWIIEGEEFSRDSVLHFPTDKAGTFSTNLCVSNADAETNIEFKVRIIPSEDAQIEITFEKEHYRMSCGRKVKISAVTLKNIPNDALFCWRCNGETISESKQPDLVFGQEVEGDYDLTLVVTGQYSNASFSVKATICPPEGTYRRSGGGEATFNRIYEFLPAPGQFVNEGYSASTMDQAIEAATQKLENGEYISLGGFGGYIVAGWDHSISNTGGYDLRICGNSHENGSEPGIVWVMQDENGDSLPNDTWYELKGSEYGKDETVSDYRVTYYKPSSQGENIHWSDNQGKSGYIEYLPAYHKQNYFPAWIESSSYTLSGICLKARNYDSSGNGSLWINGSYDWGYVDNFTTEETNLFRISDAVTFDGQPANLQYIDFVKIQTGVNAKSGWTGELSTEITSITALN